MVGVENFDAVFARRLKESAVEVEVLVVCVVVMGGVVEEYLGVDVVDFMVGMFVK